MRLGDFAFDFFGRCAGNAGADADDGKVDRGEPIDAELEIRCRPDDHEGKNDHGRKDRPPDTDFRKLLHVRVPHTAWCNWIYRGGGGVLEGWLRGMGQMEGEGQRGGFTPLERRDGKGKQSATGGSGREVKGTLGKVRIHGPAPLRPSASPLSTREENRTGGSAVRNIFASGTKDVPRSGTYGNHSRP